MKTITLYKAQRIALAKRYNEYAAPDFFVDEESVVHIFGDNCDSEMEANGSVQIELRAHEARAGVPVTFHVTEEDVNFEDEEHPSLGDES